MEDFTIYFWERTFDFHGNIVQFILSVAEGSLTCTAYLWGTFIEAKVNPFGY